MGAVLLILLFGRNVRHTLTGKDLLAVIGTPVVYLLMNAVFVNYWLSCGGVADD